MTDIKASNLSGIPFGVNSTRPSTPQVGQPFFNGQENRLELYTQNTGWQNIVGETPGVISIAGEYLESNATNTIIISGTNFVSGASTYAIGTNGVEYAANSTAVNSIVELSVVFSGLSAAYEPYDIKVVNPSNLYGLLENVLYINSSPVWTTSAGSLGTFIEKTSQSIQLATTDPEGTSRTYSITSGSLPNGLSMTSSGLISGTLTEVSSTTTYSFTVTATDGKNNSPRAFSITVTNLPPVWITPSGNLNTFTKNISYSDTVQATDAHTITYSVSSGSLPAGLTLNSNTGSITGTPTDGLAQTFTIRATNAGGDYADRSFTIPNAAPTWSTTSPLNTFTRNSAYSITLVATDDSGNIPTYSLVSGSLPTGLSLNSSTGVISGTPTSSTTATFTIRATDVNGNYAERAFTMPNAAPTWTTSSLPNATGGSAYSQQLTATDDSGNSPSYSLLSGSLPSGFTLSSSGLISGTSSSVGTASFTVRATDANGGTADRAFTIIVSSGISATGGTITTSGSYKYHVFTGSGTFSVSSNPTSTTAQVLVVAGGGPGGNDVGGGGGAGGIIYHASYSIPSGSYSVAVGGGGAATPQGNNTTNPAVGGNSSFVSMTAFGGGYSDNWQPRVDAVSGGCGGGGGGYPGVPRYGKSSTQTSNNGGTGYGNAGGNGLSPELGTNITNPSAGGGGGAGEIGQNGTLNQNGRGGNGLNTWASWATATGTGADGGYFAGGGGGASDHSNNANGLGGLGGGGLGRSGIDGNTVGTSGTANTGGGGGGSNSYPAGNGGSGIVIVRYLA